VTVAYSNSGLPLWTNRYNGPGNWEDYPLAIAVDKSGNVFVTKYSWPPRLDFQLLNNHLVLSWTNAGFSLRSAPTLTDPFTNLPAATSPYINPLTTPNNS